MSEKKVYKRQIVSHFIEQKALEEPYKEVFIFENGDSPDDKASYIDLYKNSKKVAAELQRIGIKKGDRFAGYMKNHIEAIYLTIAASMLGAIIVPIEHRAKGDLLRHQLDFSESKALFTTEDLLENVLEIKDKIPKVEHIYLIHKPWIEGKNSGKYPYLNDIIEGKEPSDLGVWYTDINMPLQMMFTSGTTGLPKGVLQRHSRTSSYSLIGQFMWGYTASDIVYSGLSWAHGNINASLIFPVIYTAAKGVVSERFTKSRIWDICREYGCTTFSLLGNMMQTIYNEPEKPNDTDNPVEFILDAGTPISIWRPFERRFNVKVLEWYGAIDGGYTAKQPFIGPIGSMGRRVPLLLDMRVLDENDNECPPYVLGQLCQRSILPALSSVSYYRMEDKSKEKTKGGWVRTGDIGHTDKDGWLFFDYRVGGGLRRAGEFILPEYIESIIAKESSVSEVGVYGIPAVSGAPGESDLVAAVAPFEGKAIDVASIFKLCKKELPKNMIPSYIQVLDELPKTISQKLLDRVLKEKFDPNAKNVFKMKDYI